MKFFGTGIYKPQKSRVVQHPMENYSTAVKFLMSNDLITLFMYVAFELLMFFYCSILIESNDTIAITCTLLFSICLSIKILLHFEKWPAWVCSLSGLNRQLEGQTCLFIKYAGVERRSSYCTFMHIPKNEIYFLNIAYWQE